MNVDQKQQNNLSYWLDGSHAAWWMTIDQWPLTNSSKTISVTGWMVVMLTGRWRTIDQLPMNIDQKQQNNFSYWLDGSRADWWWPLTNDQHSVVCMMKHYRRLVTQDSPSIKIYCTDPAKLLPSAYMDMKHFNGVRTRTGKYVHLPGKESNCMHILLYFLVQKSSVFFQLQKLPCKYPNFLGRSLQSSQFFHPW